MKGRFFRQAIFLVVVSSTLQVVLSADRSSVCGTLSGSITSASSITIPQKLKATVEVASENNGNTGEQGTISNTVVIYDYNNAYIQYTSTSKTKQNIYLYDYMYYQKMYYDIDTSKAATNRGTCKRTENLDAVPGFWLVPTDPHSAVMPSPQELFRLSGDDGFGGQIQLYSQGQTNLRGLTVNKYYSCQQLKDSNGNSYIAKVTHYLADNQFSELYSGLLPVQILFEALPSYSNGNPHTYVYNLFHYETDYIVESFDFTPAGIVCEGRIGPSTFPAQPKYISFVVESHETVYQTTLTQKVVYNQQEGYTYVEVFDPSANKRNEYRLDDFGAGLAYTVDPNQDLCYPQNITEASQIGDAKSSGGSVQIDSPSEFFETVGVDWHYNGIYYFRGVSADSWIGQSANDPNTVVQWFYLDEYTDATVNDFAIFENGQSQRVPYMIKVWSDQTQNYMASYFFQVDFTIPEFFIDLQPCYFGNMRYVQLFLPGLEKDEVTQDMNYILRSAQKTLAEHLNVRQIRINAPKMYFAGYDGYIGFMLLGKSPYSPGATETKNEPSIDEAVATLKSISGTGKLQLEVGNSVDLIKTEAFFIDTYADDRDRNLGVASNINMQYTSKDMAGLAFGMIIVGLAAGGAGGYWFFIKRA